MFNTFKYDSETDQIQNIRQAYDPESAKSSQHIACTRCHEKKLRCSGEEDGCYRCRSNNLVCEYPRPSPRSSRRGRRSHHGQSSHPHSHSHSHSNHGEGEPSSTSSSSGVGRQHRQPAGPRQPGTYPPSQALPGSSGSGSGSSRMPFVADSYTYGGHQPTYTAYAPSSSSAAAAAAAAAASVSMPSYSSMQPLTGFEYHHQGVYDDSWAHQQQQQQQQSDFEYSMAPSWYDDMASEYRDDEEYFHQQRDQHHWP